MDHRRRRVLAAVGGTVAASTAALAGCLGSDDDDAPETEDEDGETDGEATYRKWLGTGDETISFAYLNWGELRSLPDGDEDDGDGENESDESNDSEGETDDDAAPRDPMLGLPFDGVVSIVPVAVGPDLAEADLVELLADPESDESDVFDSRITAVLALDGVSVITGEIVPDEIDERLTSEPDGVFPIQFERTGETGGYDVYEAVDREHRAAAVGNDAVVYADRDDAAATVRRLIDARTDGGALDETERWLVETGGRGHFAFGGLGGPPAMAVRELGVESQSYDAAAAYESLSAVDGVVASVSIDESDAVGSFAAAFDDADAVAPSLEERLGTDATERSVEVDGARVSATARWADDEDVPGTRT